MSKKHCCKDCSHCSIEEMKCYPESRDCRVEYTLTEEDLVNYERCDFYKEKNNEETRQ